MELFAFLLAVGLIYYVADARKRIKELTRSLGKVEREVFDLKQGTLPTPAAKPQVEPQVAPPALAPLQGPAPAQATAPIKVIQPPGREAPATGPQSELASTATRGRPWPAPRSVAPAVNWEQFMGVKGFAWLGGFALFLGVAFFIKYSFDNNLISPQLRVAIGFFTGLGLLVGGVVMSGKRFPTLSQTLCATGIVVLYAVTFACHAIYHFEFFGQIPTFLLMAIITTTAFLLATRLNALVVAILGMLGGFLTPILLSTGQDIPFGLFGYIAILDVGLILVAMHRRWYFLAALAAAGTAFMQVSWADTFFTSEKYFEGNKILIALAVLLGFNVLWLAANWWSERRSQSNWWLAGSNLGLAAIALAFTAFFLNFALLAARPMLLFSFVFLIDLTLAALVRLDARTESAQPVAGFAVFGLLALWTTQHLTNDLLTAGLVFYFIFAMFHSALPALLRRRQGATTAIMNWDHFFPPLALLLVIVPLFNLTEPSFLVWPFVLLVDLLAIALAALTATLAPVLLVLLLTFIATGALIFRIPSDLTGLPTLLFLLGAFAVFFVSASVWLVRRVQPDALKSALKLSGNLHDPEMLGALLPASSAALPFLLLIMVTLRLPLADPSPVFGLALLLVVLLLGLTTRFAMDLLPLVGLAGVFMLESAWNYSRLYHGNFTIAPTLTLTWYLVFFGLFALFPFLFLQKVSARTWPWAAAALAGPAQFLLVFRLVKMAWPNPVMGLLPAVFALPALLSLVVVLMKTPDENKARLTQVAWLGGVALFFITLIFPIQFDRQWVTLGWALEGAALLWLFHRVPHSGLRLTGFGLLVAAFGRLALNSEVLYYHARSITPIFNWYLYTYGIVTVCLFLGAKLLAPPRNLISTLNVQPILAALGVVLAFLLMNIQIADYFSAPGSTLTFQFSGNFARDMSYSIGWGWFALVLLVIGITKTISAVRYAAMTLLCVTLLKLFFHDLAQLGPLYRIGAFVGVAVIAMLASFAYQRFFNASDTTRDTKKQKSEITFR
jgi:uncharacterized membrane protein